MLNLEIGHCAAIRDDCCQNRKPESSVNRLLLSGGIRSFFDAHSSLVGKSDAMVDQMGWWNGVGLWNALSGGMARAASHSAAFSGATLTSAERRHANRPLHTGGVLAARALPPKPRKCITGSGGRAATTPARSGREHFGWVAVEVQRLRRWTRGWFSQRANRYHQRGKTGGVHVCLRLLQDCSADAGEYYFSMNFRPRRHLPHEIPLWVDPHKEIYFITVNCRPRFENQLALPDVSVKLFETVHHRQERLLWWPYLFLLMPDHLHALLSFPPSDKPIRSIVSKWKEWTAKDIGIVWQDDFFEHRLRHDESRRQKADYILANPVRAGLVSRVEDWPFVYFGDGARPKFTD